MLNLAPCFEHCSCHRGRIRGLVFLLALLILLTAQMYTDATVLGADNNATPHSPYPEIKSRASASAPSHQPTGAKMPLPDPRQEYYDVTHYDIDLTVDMDAQYLSGSVIVNFSPVGQSLNELVLDFLSNMSVTSVRWRGGWNMTLGYSREEDLLAINLPFSVPTWYDVRVEVAFEGSPEPDGFYGFQFGQTAAGNPIAASLSQPWSARSWWPSKDDPRDKATYSVTLRVPDGMIGVSNGVQDLAKDTAADGDPSKTRTFYWEEIHPISTYHFSVAVADYEEIASTYTNGSEILDLVHFVYPELVAPATTDFAVLPDMLDFCIDRFGPYPFPDEKYGMAVFEWEGAMEHPTCTSWGSIMVTGDGYFGSVMLHELSHSWFGNLITVDDWTHNWLSEGLATYAQALWAEHKFGPNSYQSFMEQRNNFHGWAGPLVRDPDNPDPWYYFADMVYHKGAWVLHMLRHYLGDDPFQVCFDKYLEDPGIRYGTATSEDFVDACSAAAGEDLNWFFDQWLYWTVYPTYSITWNHNVPFDNQVLVTVEQRQDPDPVYGQLPFQMPLDLELQTASGNSTITVFNDQLSQTFTLPVDDLLQNIVLDPDGWLLFDQETFSATPPDVGGQQAVRLLPPSPNPFNPRCLLRWESDVPTRDNLEIFDLRGRRLLSHTFPRQSSGLREFVWNGCATNGEACANGIYLYRIDSQRVGNSSGDSAGSWQLNGKITLNR
ncbi:MAG: M1 family aminopeptidase [bacterium]